MKDAYDVLSDPARRAVYDRSLRTPLAVPDEGAQVVLYVPADDARSVSLVFSGSLSYVNHGVTISGALSVKPPTGAVVSVDGNARAPRGHGRYRYRGRCHRQGRRSAAYGIVTVSDPGRSWKPGPSCSAAASPGRPPARSPARRRASPACGPTPCSSFSKLTLRSQGSLGAGRIRPLPGVRSLPPCRAHC